MSQSATASTGREARILGANAPLGRGALLDAVYDSTTGSWREAPQARDNDTKRLLAFSYGFSDEEVEDHLARQEATLVNAVLDTGVLRDHPLLRDCVISEVDFTGEGSTDEHGHGTAIALILRSLMPRSPLLNVKVMRCDGEGSENALIKGLSWVGRYSKAHPEFTVQANLSCGVYSSGESCNECCGECRLCRSAVQAAKAGVLVTASAGKEPSLTACPASAAIHRRHPGISAVAAADEGGAPPH
jgi:subtilisin family serine protease